MKKKKWFSAIGEADEKFIAEADPTAHRKAKTLPWRRLAVVAACFLILFTALNVYLFKPITVKPENISAYEGSEYYGIIEKMSAYTTRTKQSARRYKNNFRRLMASGFLFGCSGEDMSNGGSMAGGRDDAPTSEGYVEITDNQTAGVTEGDRIKRTDEYIFYLDGSCLCVYDIAAESSEQVGRFDFTAVKEIGTSSYAAWEMYLSADGKTVTVVVPYRSANGMTAILSLDVSDPASITLKNKTFVSGSYISSRILASGELLLMTRFEASTANYGDSNSFIPFIGDGENSTCLAPSEIVAPDVLSSTSYTVLVLFDGVSFEEKDALAFLSYTDEVYVSAEHIFTVRTYQDEKKDDGLLIRNSMSEIAAVSYQGASLTLRGSFAVDGRVKDRYSLDAHEGMLRLVTTSSQSICTEREDRDGYTYQSTLRSIPTNANLYVYDIATLTKVAEVLRFAPDGETVRSARFEGDTAYVCTAVALTDPVFFFDLSDLSNITYKETGTIEGYSTSLVSLGNGLLLGIGYGDRSSTLKLEVYKESGTAIKSVAVLEYEQCTFSETYKAYYIDRENGVIGVGVREYGYSGRGEGYLVFRYNESIFEECAFLRVYGDNSLKRGCYADGCFYAFGQNSFAVKRLETLN